MWSFSLKIFIMTIMQAAIQKGEEYEAKYKEWCLENPGKVMNGLSSKIIAAEQVAIGCTTKAEIIAKKKLHERLADDMNKRNMVNGHIFHARACEEILELLESSRKTKRDL